MNHAPKLAKPAAPAPTWKRVIRASIERITPRGLQVRRGPGRGKRIALTFDDGPDGLTSAYLDQLEALQVPATFFVIGQAAAQRRELLLDLVARGHEVAGHGYSHRPFPSLTADELADELARTAALLPPTLTRRPLVRPPQGATSPASLVRCARAGYTSVLWSIDSDDCRSDDPAHLTGVLAPDRLQGGDIVLLHEGQHWTLDALPVAVANLRAAGFTFCTVGSLLDPALAG